MNEHTPDEERDPEAFTGAPMDDPWDGTLVPPPADPSDGEEVTDGELDSGALPGQPA